MANAVKMRETLSAMRNNLACWSQRHFSDGIVFELPDSWPVCGTTFCIAGWRCLLDGLRPSVSDNGKVRGVFFDELGNTYDAYGWAKRSMDLTADEADVLFLATAGVIDFESLVWVAERIIAGKVDLLIDHDNCGGLGCEDCHSGFALSEDEENDNHG